MVYGCSVGRYMRRCVSYTTVCILSGLERGVFPHSAPNGMIGYFNVSAILHNSIFSIFSATICFSRRLCIVFFSGRSAVSHCQPFCSMLFGYVWVFFVVFFPHLPCRSSQKQSIHIYMLVCVCAYRFAANRYAVRIPRAKCTDKTCHVIPFAGLPWLRPRRFRSFLLLLLFTVSICAGMKEISFRFR